MQNHNEEIYSIYTLRFPRTLKVFYVGMAVDPYKRFIQHLLMDGSNKEKDAIIDDLKKNAMVPVMEIECTCDGKRLAERLETYYIEYYRASKHPLVNKTMVLSKDTDKGREVYEYEQEILNTYRKLLSHALSWYYFRWTTWIYCLFLPKQKRKEVHRLYDQELQHYLAIICGPPHKSVFCVKLDDSIKVTSSDEPSNVLRNRGGL